MTIPVTDTLSVLLHGDATGQSKTFTAPQAQNNVGTILPGYLLGNFRVGLTDREAGWSLTANLKNAFDRTYYVAGCRSGRSTRSTRLSQAFRGRSRWRHGSSSDGDGCGTRGRRPPRAAENHEMKSMPLYLHETVDMNNGQIASYFDGLHDEAQPFLAQVGMHMCGFWQVNYASGRWPEALVIWELTDWQAYSAKMRAFRLPETPDPDQSVSRYMDLAPVWRSGGFDRLLIPVSWSPTPPTPPTFKSTGGVFFHQTIKVRPGEARAFSRRSSRRSCPSSAAWA